MDVQNAKVPITANPFEIIFNVTTEAKLLRLCSLYETSLPCFTDKILRCANQEQISQLEKADRLFRLFCSPTSLPVQKRLLKYGECIKQTMMSIDDNECKPTMPIHVLKIERCKQNCPNIKDECYKEVVASEKFACHDEAITEHCGLQASHFYNAFQSAVIDAEFPVNCNYKKRSFESVLYKAKQLELKQKMFEKSEKTLVKTRNFNQMYNMFKPDPNIKTYTNPKTTTTKNPFENYKFDTKPPKKDSKKEFKYEIIKTTTTTRPAITTDKAFSESVEEYEENNTVPTTISPYQNSIKTFSNLLRNSVPNDESVTHLPYEFSFRFNPIFHPFEIRNKMGVVSHKYLTTPEPERSEKESVDHEIEHQLDDQQPLEEFEAMTTTHKPPIIPSSSRKTFSRIVANDVIPDEDVSRFKNTANSYVSTAIDTLVLKSNDIANNDIVKELLATFIKIGPQVLNATTS
uniref:CPG4 domain-containing protein n=1 Tax=Rhabditophanes sp. KR3021 TaxID=114890 RepID=A0AC35TLP3_9BILA